MPATITASTLHNGYYDANEVIGMVVTNWLGEAWVDRNQAEREIENADGNVHIINSDGIIIR